MEGLIKLKSIDAEKLRKAKLANEKRIKVELKLKRAKNRQERKMIISNETMLVKHIYDHSDKDSGSYCMKAVGKVAINDRVDAPVLANRVKEKQHMRVSKIDIRR